jgi:hypothetical protein
MVIKINIHNNFNNLSSLVKTYFLVKISFFYSCISFVKKKRHVFRFFKQNLIIVSIKNKKKIGAKYFLHQYMNKSKNDLYVKNYIKIDNKNI